MRKFDLPSLNRLKAKNPWIITGVPGGAIYTAGLLEKFQHPELAIHGMPYEQAGAILHAAVSLLEEGIKFHPDRLQENIAEGYLTKIVPVHPSNFTDWFGQAFSYFGEDLLMLQLVWPDKNGKFPGDPGCVLTGQKVFDVRHGDYDAIVEQWPAGAVCGKCGVQ